MTVLVEDGANDTDLQEETSAGSNWQAGRPEGMLRVVRRGKNHRKKHIARISDVDLSHLSDVHAAGASTIPEDLNITREPIG